MKSPSKRVGVTLFLVVLLVSLVIVFDSVKERFFKKDNPEENIKNLSVEIKTDNNLKDQDGDGLTDWEEVLWKTDPDNKDTDGDKTLDGEEVALNRNPLKPGPEDELLSLSDKIQDYKTRDIDTQSVTYSVAKNLFSNYATLNQAGALNPESSKTLAEQIVKEVDSQISLINIYKKEDLITFSAKDKDQLKEYGNTLIKTMVEELQAVSQKPEASKSVKVFIDGYRQIATKLSIIPVPEDISHLHANYLNNLYKISIVIEGMSKGDDDPFLSIMLIPKFDDIAKSQSLLTEQIGKYLQDNGIIYANNEYGSLFYKSD